MLDEKLLLIARKQPLSSIAPAHAWETSGGYTLNDGLLSVVDDSGTLADSDMTQADAAKRPQYGYDQTGKFTATPANVAYDGGNKVTGWANTAPTTSRILNGLTQTNAALRPDWNATDQTVDFTDSHALNIAIPSNIALSQFSISWYGYISSSVIVDPGASTQFHLFRTPNIRISVTLNPNTSQYYIEMVVVTTGGTSLFSIITYNSLTAFKSAICDRYSHLIFTFMPQVRYAILDAVIKDTDSQTGDTVTITANASFAAIQGVSSKNVFFKVKSVLFFYTALSLSDTTLLFNNKDNMSYVLPKKYIISTGASIMSANLPSNLTLNEFSVNIWIYRQSYRNVDGVGTLIASDSYVSGSNKGFDLTIVVASLLWNFRANFGNGADSWNVATPQLSKSAFNTLYLNKYTMLGLSFKNGASYININGVNIASSVGVAGSVITSVDGIVSLMGRAGTGDMLAGNKICKASVHLDKAFCATEWKRIYNADIATNPEFAN